MEWIYGAFISARYKKHTAWKLRERRMKKQWNWKVHCWSWQKYFSFFSVVNSTRSESASGVWKVRGSLFKCRRDQWWLFINSIVYAECIKTATLQQFSAMFTHCPIFHWFWQRRLNYNQTQTLINHSLINMTFETQTQPLHCRSKSKLPTIDLIVKWALMQRV